MNVYVAYETARRTGWLRNPQFFDGDLALFFTKSSPIIGLKILEFSIVSVEVYKQRAKDELDRLKIHWSGMGNFRFAVRLWKEDLTEVCLMDFRLMGPLPEQVALQCRGESVERPSGELVRYGG